MIKITNIKSIANGRRVRISTAHEVLLYRKIQRLLDQMNLKATLKRR